MHKEDHKDNSHLSCSFCKQIIFLRKSEILKDQLTGRWRALGRYFHETMQIISSVHIYQVQEICCSLDKDVYQAEIHFLMCFILELAYRAEVNC